MTGVVVDFVVDSLNLSQLLGNVMQLGLIKRTDVRFGRGMRCVASSQPPRVRRLLATRALGAHSVKAGSGTRVCSSAVL